MVISKLLCSLILLLTCLLALVTCPHSKVEESFNIQATHDLFYHGVGPAWKSSALRILARHHQRRQSSKSCSEKGDGESTSSSEVCHGVMIADDPLPALPYDHLQFPGVVPRTFTGAFVLALVARFIAAIIVPKTILFDLPEHPMAVQFLIRLELLLLSWLAHVRLANSLEGYFSRKQQNNHSKKRIISLGYDGTTATTTPMIFGYYLLITAAQFHIPFYSSRLLPNTFALLLTTHAYAEWLNDRPHRTAMYLVFTAAIFRCDVLLLLFTVGLAMLIRRELRIAQALIIGIVTGLTSLLITVPIDTLLWQRIVWPEFEVWWFNAVDNRSSEWGVMPFYWYFSNALPKGMLLTLFLVPLAFLDLSKRDANKHGQTATNLPMVDHRLLPYFMSSFGFVFLYSFLPHKEMRFIFPALPMFNACAACGLSKLHAMAISDAKGGGSSFVFKGLYVCGLMTVFITMIGSMLFLRLSRENYPGGVALERLKNHFVATNEISMQERVQKWGDVHVHIDVAAAMTGISLFGQRSVTQLYPIKMSKSGYEAENSGNKLSSSYTQLLSEEQSVKGYHVIDTIDGFPRLDKRNLRVSTQPAIYILERDGGQ